MKVKAKTKAFWRAALIRAAKTTAQTLASTIPVGFVVTPAMIKEFDCSYLVIVGAWLATGLLAGLTSILTSIAAGLPEVDDTKVYVKGDK